MVFMRPWSGFIINPVFQLIDRLNDCIQYRSNVSYHRRALRKSRCALQESRRTLQESRSALQESRSALQESRSARWRRNCKFTKLGSCAILIGLLLLSSKSEHNLWSTHYVASRFQYFQYLEFHLTTLRCGKNWHSYTKRFFQEIVS